MGLSRVFGIPLVLFLESAQQHLVKFISFVYPAAEPLTGPWLAPCRWDNFLEVGQQVDIRGSVGAVLPGTVWMKKGSRGAISDLEMLKESGSCIIFEGGQWSIDACRMCCSRSEQDPARITDHEAFLDGLPHLPSLSPHSLSLPLSPPPLSLPLSLPFLNPKPYHFRGCRRTIPSSLLSFIIPALPPLRSTHNLSLHLAFTWAFSVA